jgi:hypothetical protein
MVFVLEDLELCDIVEETIIIIPVTAPALVTEFRKRAIRKRGSFVMQ